MSKSDYDILLCLDEIGAKNYFTSAKIDEIAEKINATTITTRRRVVKLMKESYLEEGAKSGRAYTYFLTDKGLQFVSEWKQ